MKANQESTNQTIVRFPPSPTGPLHIGNIRTFLFNYLFARKNNGKIVMRFEDTDKQRSSKEYEQEILETLAELGLDFDEGPSWQSQKTSRYKQALLELIEKGLAYEAEENQAGTGKVVRLKNPGGEIEFEDLIRGKIKIDVSQYGDFVIARSLDDPLYHLSVVVDDIDSNITHIIRGEDHITSTPRQILLYKAFGKTPPTYAHLPLIVGQDKKKLSKRHGAVSFKDFKELGILPFALINYLALLGWSPGNDKELFDSMQELIDAFELEKVSPSPAMFDYQKLFAINRYHLLKQDPEVLKKQILDWLPQEYKSIYEVFSPPQQEAFIEAIKERISKLSDVAEVAEQDFVWLKNLPEYEPENLVWKKSDKQETLKHLHWLLDYFQKNSNEFNKDKIEEEIKSYAQEHGMGNVLWPMRYALTGVKKSPDPFLVAFLLGKDRSIKRIKEAIVKLTNH